LAFLARRHLNSEELSMADKRVVADCRLFPSESGCTLTISGREDEVIRAATEHAVSVHGHEDTPELRVQIKEMLTEERVPA
jgi:uncharacterized protein DUF1059